MGGGYGDHKKQTVLQGVVNILLTAVGVGMLSLSSSVAEAGWVLGFGMFFAFGLLAVYLCLLLDWSMELAGRHRMKEIVKYEDIGEAAFGKTGLLMATLPLHASLVGCSCALIALLAENSRTLGGLKNEDNMWVSRKAFSMYWGLGMLPVACLKTMKHVGKVSSTVGVAAVFVMLVSIIVEGFRTFAENMEQDKLPKYNAWPKSGVNSVGSPFAAFTLAFAVTCTVPTILRDLENRAASGKVVWLGLALTITVYFLLALAGYLGWGAKLDGTILEKMDDGRLFVKICKGALIVTCACHYAVMLHPSCRALEDLINAHEKAFQRTCLRSSLVALTIVIAVFCKDLKVYVGILGSVTFAIIHSLLPPLFYWRLTILAGSKEQRLGLLQKTGLAAIMVMTVVGGYFGLKDAIKSFNSSN